MRYGVDSFSGTVKELSLLLDTFEFKGNYVQPIAPQSKYSAWCDKQEEIKEQKNKQFTKYRTYTECEFCHEESWILNKYHYKLCAFCRASFNEGYVISN